jgi:hypothetical protein
MVDRPRGREAVGFLRVALDVLVAAPTFASPQAAIALAARTQASSDPAFPRELILEG